MKITITKTIECGQQSITKSISAEVTDTEFNPELSGELWKSLNEQQWSLEKKGVEDAKAQE